jgi:hypothetical protein
MKRGPRIISLYDLLDVSNFLLNLAGVLLALAFSFHFVTADCMPDRFFDLTLCFVSSAFNFIFRAVLHFVGAPSRHDQQVVGHSP